MAGLHVTRRHWLGQSAALLAACLVPDKLMGWPMRVSEQALGYLSPTLAALPHLGRLSSGGRGSTMPLEKLVALAPDLVLDTGTVDATYRSGMEKIAQQIGLPCVLMQGALDGPPGINRLIGVRWLIDKLYPGHAALKDQPPLAEAAAEFYALFYGSQRSVADMQKLLADSE